MDNNSFFDMIAASIAAGKKASNSSVEKGGEPLTFKRDEKGVLWSYDAKTGEKVGRIHEHGDDDRIDTIKEV